MPLPASETHEMSVIERRQEAVPLSSIDVPPKERLIVALDVATHDQARGLIEEIGDAACFYKIGLELVVGRDYLSLVEKMRDAGHKVFLDLKIFDVPATVKRAVAQLRDVGVSFVSVHGNDDTLRAACEARYDNSELKVLAITVLTSIQDPLDVAAVMDMKDVAEVGFEATVRDLVLSRARRALDIGVDGVIASGLEAAELRGAYGERILIVTPGIRETTGTDFPADDQRRTVGVREAFERGADYIVVGRPIRDAPSPREAALGVQREIRSLFAGS
jgi:orotidine-5'-phosphate decarboxylase